MSIAECIVQAATELGFVRTAFTPVEPMRRGREALQSWLNAGMHGSMAYMAGPADRADPSHLLEHAKTLVVVTLPHDAGTPEQNAQRIHGRVARYAWGRDYHRVLKERLTTLGERCSAIVGRAVASRPCVDTAPLLEREAAHRSGLGFIAKNTMLIVPGIGSYLFLGELLLDVEITAGNPSTPRCGDCTACLDMCPTQAFVAPHVLDARRCISYLTIELRGSIPRDLRPLIGTWVYGCDVCQEVCPFNAGRGLPHDPAFHRRPDISSPDLIAWLRMTAGDYRRLTKGSPIGRAPRRQLARNAAVALGNLGDPVAIPHLIDALQSHKEALVRGHAAWALGRFSSTDASAALTAAINEDTSPEVREEAKLALEERYSVSSTTTGA